MPFPTWIRTSVILVPLVCCKLDLLIVSKSSLLANLSVRSGFLAAGVLRRHIRVEPRHESLFYIALGRAETRPIVELPKSQSQPWSLMARSNTSNGF